MKKIVLVLLIVSITFGGFNECVWAACDYCSEPNCADYLVCEDWDIGTPPDPWPTKGGETWHGWTPADYGQSCMQNGAIVTQYSHSGNRCLLQYCADGCKDQVDIEHPISGQPTTVFVRFYLYLTEANMSASHFIFLNSAASAEVALDFRSYPKNDYSGPKGCYLVPHSYSPEVWLAKNTDADYFNFKDHLNEWVLVEWMVDFLNDKSSLWINEIQLLDNYSIDWNSINASKVIISGFRAVGTTGEQHYYIDDIVISTSYIGPLSTGPDLTPPTRSNHQPIGTLSSGTTTANISLTTNVQAVCRYSNVSGTNYTEMEYNFTYTNSTNHSTQISGLENGNTYIYYIRCNSSYGYVNVDDWNITFSVGGHKADINNDGVIDMHELMLFIARWKINDGVSRAGVEEARDIWFSGGWY